MHSEIKKIPFKMGERGKSSTSFEQRTTNPSFRALIILILDEMVFAGGTAKPEMSKVV